MEVFPGFTTPIRHPWIDGHFKRVFLIMNSSSIFLYHLIFHTLVTFDQYFAIVRVYAWVKVWNHSIFQVLFFPHRAFTNKRNILIGVSFMCLSMLILSTKPVWVRFWIHPIIYFPIFSTWWVQSSYKMVSQYKWDAQKMVTYMHLLPFTFPSNGICQEFKIEKDCL